MDLPKCKYGSKCYRQNPAHFEEFSHPPDFQIRTSENSPETSSTDLITSSEKNSSETDCGEPAAKKAKPSREETNKFEPILKNSSGFHLTKIAALGEKWNGGCFCIRRLLNTDKEKLISSAHFNFMIDFQWLMNQYHPMNRDNPLLLVVGEKMGKPFESLKVDTEEWENVTLGKARLDQPFGTHHTKMMLLKYSDGIRVVIHTSNLIQQDWLLKTQGIFITPLCPKIEEIGSEISGESPSNFRADLIDYLRAYKLNSVLPWIEDIKNHDFSQVEAYLIGSVPGRHFGDARSNWGHMRLRKILTTVPPTKDVQPSWPVIGQFSSIGSLGAAPELWLTGEFLTSLSGNGPSIQVSTKPGLKLVFPTVENVRTSLEGYLAGGSIPYNIQTAKKQPYLKKFFHQWIADRNGRSRASPHIKSYARVSPDGKSLAWFLITSANLSKAAWGALEKSNTQLFIRSYELGVLFKNQDGFATEDFLPFDLPLTAYGPEDEPWIVDLPYLNKTDTNGDVWPPK